jgi:hypothetical protein
LPSISISSSVNPNRLFDDVQLLLGQVQFLGHFFLSGSTAKFFLELGGRTPPFGEKLDHVSGDADGFTGVDQSTFDGLLDPVTGIGTEASVHVGIKAFDCTQQAEVALLNEVLQGQPLAGVVAGDVDNQSQVGSHHLIPSGIVAMRFDSVSQLPLFFTGEQGSLIDFT